jgi:hypothetical protein
MLGSVDALDKQVLQKLSDSIHVPLEEAGA